LSGIKFPLFKGYLHKEGLASQLASLPFEEKVDYFKARVKLVILDPLNEVVRLEKQGITSKYHLLNIVTLLSCCIDGLGSFLVPASTSKRQCFEKFATEFMDQRFRNVCKSTGTEYWSFIWDYFRNGMAHSVCIEKGGIERRCRYFKDDPVEGLIVNVDLLLKDFNRGIKKLIKKLQTDGPIGIYGNTFENRFKRVFVKR
jgi:hypothetical protein